MIITSHNQGAGQVERRNFLQNEANHFRNLSSLYL